MSGPTFMDMIAKMPASELEYIATDLVGASDVRNDGTNRMPGWLFAMYARALRSGSKTCRTRVLRSLRRYGWRTASAGDEHVVCGVCRGSKVHPSDPTIQCWYCKGTGQVQIPKLTGVTPTNEMLKLGV